MNPNLLEQCKLMIYNATRMGHAPVALVMNGNTQAEIRKIVAIMAQERLSAFGRLLARLRAGKSQEGPFLLHGLPVLINSQMPDSLIALQVGVPMVQGPGDSRQAHVQMGGSPVPEFQEQKAAPAEESPTLDALASSSGKITSSDVLMKAFDGVDRIKQIVVIRVYDNDDVDLCLNCNQFEANGILTKAMHWLIMRG